MIDADDLTPVQPYQIALAALLLVMTLLVGADIVLDARTGVSPEHLPIDLLIAALGLGGTLVASARLFGALRGARALRDRLRAAEGEAHRFREESRAYLRGLAVAIDRQLVRWALSPAEREVVLLLLKGLSLKEIGDVRGCSERTVRHQARAVYRKAGLAGRIELAAFFLEDLLLPVSSAEPERPAEPVRPVEASRARSG